MRKYYEQISIEQGVKKELMITKGKLMQEQGYNVSISKTIYELIQKYNESNKLKK